MRQNMVFFNKKYEKFSGKGAVPPSPDPSPSGEWDTPTTHPLGASGTSTPPILKSWERHCIQSSKNPQQKIAKLIESAATKLATVAYILHTFWSMLYYSDCWLFATNECF